MDYTIGNNAKLFDEILAVLERYRSETGVVEAIEDLKAAKINYVQRSIDHMMNCLVLVIHDLVVHPPSEALRNELASAIEQFQADIFRPGPKLSELAHAYEASGGKPLSRTEILQEVDERRGGSR